MFLNGSEVEVWFSEDKIKFVWLEVEGLLAEHVVPHRLLVVPVHQVPFLKYPPFSKIICLQVVNNLSAKLNIQSINH